MKQDIIQIYKKLPGCLVPWYQENSRKLPWRKDREPYHIWLSEIMLQQTRVEAVKEYYKRFLDAFPDIQDLADAREDHLLKLWEGLGYYNRARNLQKAAKIIVEELNGNFPAEYQEIIKLPGIGEYTAGAIASISFNEPVAAVDGNVLRVISRITECYDDIAKASTKKKIKSQLEHVYPESDCGIFTQSLIELGALICVPAGKPKCEICPVADFCAARCSGTQELLPVKNIKKERRMEERTVFLLECRGKIAVLKRSDAGLLAGMWEFPNVLGAQKPAQALDIVQTWGCKPLAMLKEADRKHIFSHVQWNMKCFYIQCEAEPEQFNWISRDEINEKIALPTAFRQFVAVLG